MKFERQIEILDNVVYTKVTYRELELKNSFCEIYRDVIICKEEFWFPFFSIQYRVKKANKWANDMVQYLERAMK